MDIEIAKEILKGIDIKFFLNGMTEQSNYIVDKADEINIAIDTVLSELEKKEKQIDLMAEFINKFDLDESICKDIKCNNDVTKQDCINCIKKYFFDTKKNIF